MYADGKKLKAQTWRKKKWEVEGRRQRGGGENTAYEVMEVLEKQYESKGNSAQATAETPAVDQKTIL